MSAMTGPQPGISPRIVVESGQGGQIHPNVDDGTITG